jgi:hypothetical protein
VLPSVGDGEAYWAGVTRTNGVSVGNGFCRQTGRLGFSVGVGTITGAGVAGLGLGVGNGVGSGWGGTRGSGKRGSPPAESAWEWRPGPG